MSNAIELSEKLPTDSNVRAWTPPQRAIMTQLGLIDRSGYNGRSLPDAPAGVIESFLTQCQRTRLDPMARQIYCIERGGKWGVQISIDGFRLIAERSKGYRGQTPAQWTADGREWLDVWLADEPPAAARVGVYREGFDAPQFAVATFAGYCPRDRDGALAPKNQWLTNPSNQLAKCAEMLALRKAFPNELSGLYGTEEMDQASSPAVTAQEPQAGAQGQREQETRTVPAPTQVVGHDWAAEVLAVRDIDSLRQIHGRASANGELGLPFGGEHRDSVLAVIQAWELPTPQGAVTPGMLIKIVKARIEAGFFPADGDVVDAEVVEETTEWPTATIPNGDAA